MTHAPDDPDRDIARELRLRDAPHPVVRLSRRAIALTAGVVSLSVAGVVAWSLAERPEKGATAAAIPVAPAEARPPEQLAALPKDYAGLPPGVPKLGPPLPGDLGRPMLAAGMARRDIDAPAVAGPRGSPAGLERDEARASRLFAATTAAPAAPRTSDERSPAPSVDKGLRSAPGSVGTHLLPAGTTVRAALITGLRSDLPGPVLAQVTEDVFDGATGGALLVPRGSRLVGAYDSKVAFGQDRLFVAWSQLVLPDGRTVDLDKAPATDGAGQAGFQDRVDRRWRHLVGASVVSLVTAAAAEVGRSHEEAELTRALRLGLADTAAQAGDQVIGRSLSAAPALSIRPGFTVRVLLTQTLALPAWRSS